MRRLWRWLFHLRRGWGYEKIGGQWILVATRPLTVKGWKAARKDAAVSLPVMNAMEALFADVTDGRVHFVEDAEAAIEGGSMFVNVECGQLCVPVYRAFATNPEGITAHLQREGYLKPGAAFVVIPETAWERVLSRIAEAPNGEEPLCPTP